VCGDWYGELFGLSKSDEVSEAVGEDMVGEALRVINGVKTLTGAFVRVCVCDIRLFCLC